ncbi:hypothetical protein [Glaciihabitans sp. dw_435]|uniref:hypothetical protein n=1 Tax=Glaciihabitans sp. dw_435 TaxID=2720081 RepID=UPI001BD25E90|nr:hypothetical protein [Glaciihabitans sp. dw_435]
MTIAIVVCGALGAWLLLAGPLYQAALELREQEVDRDGIEAVSSTVAAADPVSPWWWLLPPVAYILHQRSAREHRRALMEAMGPDQIRQTVEFLNKANGWLIVAAGAFLIAVKETYELVELVEWPIAVFWVLVVVLPLICFAYVIFRFAWTGRMLRKDEDVVADRIRRRDGSSTRPARPERRSRRP